LECQEDSLIKENKKFVKLKNAYAQEVDKYGNLSKELSICHDSISSLKTENASLVSKIEKLNVYNESISSLKIENDMLGLCFVAEDPKKNTFERSSQKQAPKLLSINYQG
jgi:Leucine-rich repeat (LRR) protein